MPFISKTTNNIPMKVAFCVLFFTLSISLSAQSTFDPSCKLLTSGSYVQDKNFYLLTVLTKVPEVRKLLSNDQVLSSLLVAQKSKIIDQNQTCELDIDCMLEPFFFDEQLISEIGARLSLLAQREPALLDLIRTHMRRSGVFMRHAGHSDPDYLKYAWEDAANGLNNILETYGKGRKGRYPNIDSVSYSVESRYYKRVIRTVVFSVENNLNKHTLFFEPSLQLALTLLDINSRDEAGRHEPMEYLENRKAVEYIPTINWEEYPYAVILQPGHGPEKEGLPLSPLGKMRVKLVAERYHNRLAPLIILSGGYVHPYQTPFAEATEMKKALIEQYGVPERAIIIEPHARHTTTNFRNAARLMFRYGIPTEKMSVCTSTFDQIIYITDPQYQFDQRNMNELGYLPYQLFEKVSRNDVEFKPLIISLYADPTDPLDP
jgi:hypothetical protein